MFSRAWHSMKRAYTRTIERYADLLERRPYATQCSTSAVLWRVPVHMLSVQLSPSASGGAEDVPS